MWWWQYDDDDDDDDLKLEKKCFLNLGLNLGSCKSGFFAHEKFKKIEPGEKTKSVEILFFFFFNSFIYIYFFIINIKKIYFV